MASDSQSALSAMEIRQSQRMHMSIPIRYRIQMPESSEGPWTGQGVLKNLSQGGAYFTCEDHLQLDLEIIGYFTISTISPSTDLSINSDIVFKGLVKRIEPSPEGSNGFGVAVQLLSPLEIVPRIKAQSTERCA
jgi:hypothetical protein